MIHYTYQTKNLVNGKTYIGVHSTNNPDDGYIGTGRRLLEAVQKHGKENFKCIPMCYFDTREEANEEESYLVDEKWIKDDSNYNSALGGGNSRGWVIKDTSKYTESNNRRWNDPEYRKNISEKVSRTLSKPVEFKGKIYRGGARELSKKIGVNYETIKYRCQKEIKGFRYSK